MLFWQVRERGCMLFAADLAELHRPLYARPWAAIAHAEAVKIVKKPAGVLQTEWRPGYSRSATGLS